MTQPRYATVSCSQCGRDFGPGDHGFSHCDSHRKIIGTLPGESEEMMLANSALEYLVCRLSAAAVADRDLDATIAVAITPTVKTDDDLCYARRRDPGNDATHPGHYFMVSRSGASARSAPAYTASMDVALTLVPSGSGWNVQDNTNVFHAMVAGHSGNGKTAAIALCAAALAARAAVMHGEHGA